MPVIFPRTFLFLTAIIACGFPSVPGFAQEWTRFRGPNGSGISAATTIPVKWADRDYNWKIKLPGAGHGSPVVWKDRLFLMAAEDGGAVRIVLCVQTTTGKILWRQKFASKSHRKHRNNSYASSTPAVDEKRVYVAWATPQKLTLMALDHDGNVKWEKDLGPLKGNHGFAASPIVYKDMVILANDQNGKSSLIAVDRATGKVRWNVPRRSRRLTYSTPCVYRRKGRPEELIFTNWRHGITGVDPATGKTNWEISVFDQSSKERAIGSPIVAGELIVGTCGFVKNPKHAVVVRPGDGAKPKTVKEIFRVERNVPHIPSPLVYRDRLYLWADNGVAACYDMTGKLIWQQRVGGNFFGSPVCINGRLYGISRRGTVVVLATGDTYKLLGKTDLGEACQTTPAIAGGVMFIRTESALVSVGGKKE
ncbi:MAG: PQQ-binding-like beta-propeller repeat protein [Planctomycetaceae bacterium]